MGLTPDKRRCGKVKTTQNHFSGNPTNRDLWENPCTILKSMPEKLFMVYLNGAEDPLDLAYHQPVRASKVEVSGDCLSFLKADGTLAAFFDKSAVRSWREMNESELLAD
jgi:hypothetical protein